MNLAPSYAYPLLSCHNSDTTYNAFATTAHACLGAYFHTVEISDPDLPIQYTILRLYDKDKLSYPLNSVRPCDRDHLCMRKIT